MGINTESDQSAELQVGATTSGMVRIYVATEQMEIPMDFTPDEAEEIASELTAAAASARDIGEIPAPRQPPPKRSSPKSRVPTGKKGRRKRRKSGFA